MVSVIRSASLTIAPEIILGLRQKNSRKVFLFIFAEITSISGRQFVHEGPMRKNHSAVTTAIRQTSLLFLFQFGLYFH